MIDIFFKHSLTHGMVKFFSNVLHLLRISGGWKELCNMCLTGDVKKLSHNYYLQ